MIFAQADLRRPARQTTARYLRAESAQQNSFENLPLYAAAIAVGTAARLPTSFMNKFVATYFGLRALYTILYINTTNAGPSNIRSIAYIGSESPSPVLRRRPRDPRSQDELFASSRYTQCDEC